MAAATASFYYFQGRGRGETSRWMLAATETAFESKELSTHEEFLAMKEKDMLLFGQLPLLEIDGLRLVQSSAIILYLAKKANMCGDTLPQEARCVEIAGAVSDLANGPMMHAFKPDKAASLEGCRTLYAKFGARLEKILKENDSAEFMVGDRLSYADVLVAEAVTSYTELVPEVLADTPLLAKLQAKVIELPGLKSYLASAQRWPIPGDVYVANVSTVLNR